MAALAVVGRDVGRVEAAALVGGTKQVDGWGKDVASARTRHGQDKLCRRWCVGGRIVVCSVRGMGGGIRWMMMMQSCARLLFA